MFLLFTRPYIHSILDISFSQDSFSCVNGFHIGSSIFMNVAKEYRSSTTRLNSQMIAFWKIGTSTLFHIIEIDKQGCHATTTPHLTWRKFDALVVIQDSEIMMETKKFSLSIPHQLQGFHLFHRQSQQFGSTSFQTRHGSILQFLERHKGRCALFFLKLLRMFLLVDE